MNYRLIAVDLDDSLLGSDLKISQANKMALFAAREQGVQVTIATGRMLRSAMPYIRELQIDIPVITYQGAYLKNTQTGEDIIKRSIPMKYVLSILEECKKENLHLQVFQGSSYFFEQSNQYSRLYHSNIGIQGEKVGNLKHFLKEEPLKIMIIDEPARTLGHLKHFQKRYGDVLQVLISRPNYLEFTNIEATKGNALAALGTILDIPRIETIAIGDSNNDISMIEYAGLGVAMGNAPDHIKSYAQYITRGNDEDGVADVLEKFVLKRSDPD